VPTLQYRVGWNTGSLNPGVSVFHGRVTAGNTDGAAATDLSTRVRTLFDTIKGLVTGAVTWDFPAEVLKLNTTTGDLEGVESVTKPLNVVSGAGGSYAAPAGARIEWRTTAIVGGRRLRGRTFVVPLGATNYDTNGTISSSCITTLTAAGNAYKDTGVFTAVQPSIYSRTHGTQADITSVLIPDEAAVLRSRRE